MANIEQILSGAYRITWTTNGRTTDLSDEILANNRKHVMEIEKLLSAAGEPFEA